MTETDNLSNESAKTGWYNVTLAGMLEACF